MISDLVCYTYLSLYIFTPIILLVSAIVTIMNPNIGMKEKLTKLSIVAYTFVLLLLLIFLDYWF